MTKKSTSTVAKAIAKAATSTKKPTAAKGRSIAANLKITGQRVAKAIGQNADNISSGGIR